MDLGEHERGEGVQSFISSELFPNCFHLREKTFHSFPNHLSVEGWQITYAPFSKVLFHSYTHLGNGCLAWSAAGSCPVKAQFANAGRRVCSRTLTAAAKALLVHFACLPPWLRYCLKMWHCRVGLPADGGGRDWRVFGWRMWGITVTQHCFVSVCVSGGVNGGWKQMLLHSSICVFTHLFLHSVKEVYFMHATLTSTYLQKPVYPGKTKVNLRVTVSKYKSDLDRANKWACAVHLCFFQMLKRRMNTMDVLSWVQMREVIS